jgi:hypothetical protein
MYILGFADDNQQLFVYDKLEMSSRRSKSSSLSMKTIWTDFQRWWKSSV